LSIVILVLKILGWTVLGVLALVIIALFIPVHVDAQYRSGTVQAKLRWLFLSFRLFDSSVKKAAKEVKEADEKLDAVGQGKPPEEAQSKAVAKPKFRADLTLIQELLDPSSRFLRTVLRNVAFLDVCAVTVARGKDAAEVGVQTGRLWAFYGMAMGFLGSRFRTVRYREVAVIPDFTGSELDSERYSCTIRLMPYIMGVAAAALLLRSLAPLRRHSSRQQELESGRTH